MRTHKVLAAGAAPLALAVLFLAGGHAADEKDLKANLEKVVKTAADKPDDVQKAGADFAKANKIDNDSIKDVMDFLGKRDPTDPKAVGWGVGKKPGDVKADGIELKLREMAKLKPMGKAQMEKEQAALVELANRTAAVGSISLASPPKKNLPGKDPKDWKKWSEEMVKAAKDFEKAAKEGDPKTVKEAAVKLNSSCVDCHGTFRD
jgi:soluble cytochrome b562